MTQFGVTTSPTYTAEKRSWLAGPHGTEPGTTPSVTLDLSKFPASQFKNQIIPSGTVLGKITETGLYGPYDPGASDGTQTPAGLLFSTLPLRAGTARAGNAILIHGFVDAKKLPIDSGAGALDDAAKKSLTLIHFGQ